MVHDNYYDDQYVQLTIKWKLGNWFNKDANKVINSNSEENYTDNYHQSNKSYNLPLDACNNILDLKNLHLQLDLVLPTTFYMKYL